MDEVSAEVGTEGLDVPRRRAIDTKKVFAHVVVDTDYPVASRYKRAASLRANQAAGPGDDASAHPFIVPPIDLGGRDGMLGDMVVINTEISPQALTAAITPEPAFFVRSHFEVPDLDTATHVLTIEGAVGNRLELSIDDLRAMPQHTTVATLECAGNNRTAMNPLPPGEPWNGGAVSTATWGGVRLDSLLQLAELGDTAVEILSEGADSGIADDGSPLGFIRSMPVDMASTALVALTMNGAPLTAAHGAPVRLVVPRWYGVASVKWLRRIEAITQPYQGWFQRDRYVIDLGDGSEPVAVQQMAVSSLLAAPLEPVAAGAVTLSGWAWSGNGEVARVAVALDGQWVDAAVEHSDDPNAWSRWSLTTDLSSGTHQVRCRAWDSTGQAQPLTVPWNRLGYVSNAARNYSVVVH